MLTSTKYDNNLSLCDVNVNNSDFSVFICLIYNWLIMASECSACKSMVLVTQKRIKCTKCSFMYHLECVSTDSNPPPRLNWVCPTCIAAARKGGDNSNTPVRMPRPTQESDIVASSPELQAVSDPASSSGSGYIDSAILTEIKNLRAEMINHFQQQDKKLDSFNQILSAVRAEVDGVKSTVDILQTNCKYYEASLIKQKEKVIELESSINELKSSITFIATQYDDMSLEFKKNMNSLSEMHTSNNNEQLIQLRAKVNILESISRSHNIEIQCVPERKNENILAIVKNLFTKLSLQFAEDTVSFCSRVPKMNGQSARPRNIIVTLQSPRHRDHVISAAHRYNKLHSGDRLNSLDLGVSGDKTFVYISEHLTPECKIVYAAARKFKNDNKFKYVWVRNGKVFLRKSDSSPALYIRNLDSLSKLS